MAVSSQSTSDSIAGTIEMTPAIVVLHQECKRASWYLAAGKIDEFEWMVDEIQRTMQHIRDHGADSNIPVMAR